MFRKLVVLITLMIVIAAVLVDRASGDRWRSGL